MSAGLEAFFDRMVTDNDRSVVAAVTNFLSWGMAPGAGVDGSAVSTGGVGVHVGCHVVVPTERGVVTGFPIARVTGIQFAGGVAYIRWKSVWAKRREALERRRSLCSPEEVWLVETEREYIDLMEQENRS